MEPPLRSSDERRRLEALQQYRLLDTLPEQALDDLTALAAHICDTPIALISIADDQRQWFKSKIGLSISEVVRAGSFSEYALLQSGVFIVPDASQDPRFAAHPLVTGAPHLRFYAGAPLVTADGQALGTVCVIDRIPRQLTPSQEGALRALSRQVMAQFELRRQTRQLIESEARLRLVTDNAHVGLVILDPERRYVYANPTYAEILALPSPAIVGRRVADVLPAVYEEQIRPRLDRAFAGERVSYEWCRSEAGIESFFAVSYEPTTVDGSVALVVVVVTDISERRRSALASHRLAAIVESSGDAIVSMDMAGTITSWNRGAEEILGSTASDMVGTSILQLIPPGRQKEEPTILEAITRGESVKQFETLRQTRDGRLIDVSITASPIKDATGAVVGVSKVTRDITERKQAATALREERERAEQESRRSAEVSAQAETEFRALFAANPLPMWIYDVATWRFLEVNDAAVQHYGYGRAEFLAMTIREIRPPEDVERLVADRDDPREPWLAPRAWRHRLKSGEVIDVEITSHTITFAGQTAALVVAQDITTRKRAEEAQRASETRYRTLFDYAPDGIVIADRNSYYLDANASMCRMLGYTRDEFVGLHATDIVVPEEIRHIGSALRAIVGPSDYHREWQFRRKDGSTFAADVIATSMPDGNLLAVIRDVTERNRSIEALRATEERMRFALENAEVGIWDMDYTTGALEWSTILEAQYGLPPGGFGGTLEAWMELVHPADRAAVLETTANAVQRGDDFSVLHRTLWGDGTVRWLSGSGRIILDTEGRPVRGVGISLDVTERRTLEAQFQQAQKMEAIGRLAGGVAHDFNNLLTVMLGYCELLLEDLDARDPRWPDIAAIRKAGERAAELTRQLLTFSRKQIIEPTLLDLNAVVAGLRPMIERLIGEDVKVVVSLGSGIACVKADRGQLEQVVMNLAVNARDAMPHGGTLTIATANVDLDEHYAAVHRGVIAGPHVALMVTDTGTGMSPEVQARLFEPFFTTKEVGKGTGLGLATVHGVVLRSGGSVGVYSEVGKGTSFTVYLPRAEAVDAPAEAPALISRPRVGTETVLVVEDADGLRELTRRLLERQGYTVLLAANADDALRIVEQTPSIDLLLTDVVMPGASGPELTRTLLQQRPALKVIYMSGYTEDAIVQHGVLNPGIAFLHKPFSAEALGRKIRDVLDR